MVSVKKSSSSPDRRRHGTSSSGRQLPVTSSVGVTRSFTSFLGEVTQTAPSSNINPPTGASFLDSSIGTSHSSNINPPTTASLHGQNAAAGTNVTREIRPPETAKGDINRYRACTSSSRSRLSGVAIRGEMYSKHFPPLIPSLGISGRPRFSYKKVTWSDERVSMDMIKSDKPDLVHYTTFGDDGESIARKTVARLDEESDDSENNKEEMTCDREKNKEVMTGDPEKNKEDMTDDREDNDRKNKEEMAGDRGKNKEVMTGDPEKKEEEMTDDREDNDGKKKKKNMNKT